MVTEVDGAAAEPALLGQGQVQADLVGQGPGAAAHHGRHDEQLVFVYQSGRDRLGRELRTADGEVAAGRFLQLADLVRVEVPLDAGPGGVRGLEGGGIDDLGVPLTNVSSAPNEGGHADLGERGPGLCCAALLRCGMHARVRGGGA